MTYYILTLREFILNDINLKVLIEEIPKQKRCYLIGSTTLLINCCDTLIRNGWSINGIISNDPIVIDYARKNNILLKDYKSTLNTFLSKSPFDYLFSIVNDIILSKTILKKANKFAINYHDSLLPRGAGVFSTTWSIINQENEHGITWHVIDDKIDTGVILKQVKIPIDKKDTTFSLNLKCYQAAIESFTELLYDIEMGTIQPQKQNVAKRTYFPRNKRPEDIGVINFFKSEHKLESYLRALEFGRNYTNKFCSPKILLNETFFIIKEYSWSDTKDKINTGVIKQADANSIDIQIGSKVLSISKLDDIEGESVELPTIIKNLNLKQNDSLHNSKKSYLLKINDLYKELIKDEEYWIKELSEIDLIEFPFISKDTDYVINQKYSYLKYDLSSDLIKYLEHIKIKNIGTKIISFLLMFISRLSDNYEFDILYKINSNYSQFPELFSSFIPLKCKVNKYESVKINMMMINNQIMQVLNHKTFSRDIFTRIKSLQTIDVKSLLHRVPFFIGIIDSIDEIHDIKDTNWGILISPKSNEIYIIYNDCIENRKVARKFIHHLSVFSQNIISMESDLFFKTPILTKEEIDERLKVRNKLKTYYPKDQCIHELIEKWTLESPKETAIILKNEKISYDELNSMANKIAFFLINKGIKIGQKVGVMMDRSIYVVVSYLGILKAGAAYVPLDPNLPDSRIDYMIEDSEINLLIIDKAKSSVKKNIETVSYSDISNINITKNNISLKISSNNLAYIKYTSGSSGIPKGVMITHKNVLGFLYSYKTVVNINERRIGSCVAPLNFDTSVEEIYSCICFGGTVHIMMVDQFTDLEYFAKYLVKNNINVSYIIPDFVDGVGKYLKKENEISLKTLITGLYPKKNKIFRNYFEINNNILVINAYGPTEVTYGSNAYNVKGDENPLGFTPIGKPFPNYQNYVVDSNMQLVPDYIPGQLLIGGVGLSCGYINKPDTTKLQFGDFKIGNFITKVYKSGDIVYSLPTGDLQFVGRKDDQVKIRGFRIEISEIETALNNNEIIAESVVIKKRSNEKHDQLVAYISLNTKVDKIDSSIREYLKGKIPNYMIPSFIIEVKSIPRLLNGKINYSQLPEPVAQKRNDKIGYKKPKNKTEEKLQQIFEEHLDIGQIGVDDSYFYLGGDSLTAVQIILNIEETFDIKIPISSIYEYPTIRKLAKELGSEFSESKNNLIVPIRKKGTNNPVFFIHGLDGSVLTYNDIIRYIDSSYPIYGIQSKYNSNSDDNNLDIETMAIEYVNEIIKITKNKQIALIGYSFGGIVAFEMSRQLKQIGYNVQLIMLDSLFSSFYKKMYPKRFLIISMGNFIKWLLSYSSKAILKFLINMDLRHLKDGYYRIKFELFSTTKRSLHSLILKPIYGPDLNETMVKSLKMAEKFYPQVYFGDLLLIQCTGEEKDRKINKSSNNFLRAFSKGKIKIARVERLHSNIKTGQGARETTNIINEYLESTSS